MTTKLTTVSPDQINRAQQTAGDDTTLTEARKSLTESDMAVTPR